MQRLPIELRTARQNLQDRLDLAGEVKVAIDLRIIERLYAEAIADEVQQLLFSIVKADGEHPLEAFDHRKPVSAKEMENDLRVRMTGKDGAGCFQLRA